METAITAGKNIRMIFTQKVGDGMEVLIEVIAYVVIWAMCDGLKRYK